MKKLILCITFLLTVQVIVAQSTYKTEMENGSDSYIEIQIGTRSVTIIGHDKDEIIITTDFSGEYIDEPVGQTKEVPQRASGLKPISVSASDNTGIGLVVDKSENHFSVLKISKNARNKSYTFKIPNKVNLSINDIHADVNTNYMVNDFMGEAEINALNSEIKMADISGPVVANATNGNVEIRFSELTPEKPNSILSVNGYVDVTLPEETAADLQLHTVNGEAYTDWDIDIDKDASAALQMGGAPNMNMFNLEGTINGGGIPISIQSVNGDIFLRKKK
ncbi:MAG: DUF4097 domain-containing protein [Cytophagales bacterium]|nr:DUF4097 domain-containing protein [Cytophagales bacterium]